MDILQSDVFAVLDKPADFITNGITHLEYHSDFGLWRLIIYETKKIGLQFDGFLQVGEGRPASPGNIILCIIYLGDAF